jgi:PTS system galactitol-specific IIB component
MHAAFKLREYLDQQKIQAVIDGAGNNELDARASAYDIIISNTIVTTKTDRPVFSAVPLLTGIGETELVNQVIEAIRKIQAQKG